MADHTHGHRAHRVRKRRRRIPKTRWNRLVAFLNNGRVAFAGIFVAIAGSILVWGVVCDGLAAKHLTSANSHANLARQELLRLDYENAQIQLESARRESEAAQDLTQQWGPAMSAKLPIVGRPFAVVRDLATVAAQLTESVFPPATRASSIVATQGLRSGDGVNLQAIAQAREAAHAASIGASRATTLVRAIPTTRIGFIDDRVAKVRDEVDEISRQARFIDSATRIIPGMLGADGPRSYFIGFQTNSEARGTGGLVGGGAIAQFDNGSLLIDKATSRAPFADASSRIDLGADFENLYGVFDPSMFWVNSNLSPHFPYTGQIWQHLWKQQSGQEVDGALSVDPVALSYVLDVTGSITLDSGEVVTAANVVPLTESDVYFRFGDDVDGRKAFLSEIASAVAKKVGDLAAPVAPLLNALGRGVSEGRIAIWSDRPEEQSIIMNTPLAHAVPYSPSPYADIVINNSGGTKLDYYLERHLSYSGEVCRGDTRETTATARLTNNAPKALPDYVVGLPFLGTRERGTNHLTVAVVATWGAGLRNAEVNGRSVPVRAGWEMGHPVYQVDIDVPRGMQVEVSFHLLEPTVAGRPDFPVQPLVADTTTSVTLPEC